MTTIFRDENQALTYMNLSRNALGFIGGKDLELLKHWALTAEVNEFIKKLESMDILFADDKMKNLQRIEIQALIKESEISKGPLRSLRSPDLLHVELTTRCPLKCPQCYTGNTGTVDIDFDLLMEFLQEAARLKVFFIALSGGEPLAYPRLTEIVAKIRELGMGSTIATSGCGLNGPRLAELERAGIGWIWVSLNGSTEEIHNLSRDKFADAVRALELLKESNLNYGINWVARQDNAFDFPQLVTLAIKHGVKYINVLRLKPDLNDEVESSLIGPEFFRLADYVKNYQDPQLNIVIEGCFSIMRTGVDPNRFRGPLSGCGGGRRLMALSVDGSFRACRHMGHPEKWQSIEAYWYGSKILTKLRSAEENVGDPCKQCRYLTNCITCRITCAKTHGDFFAGERECPVWQSDL